VYLFYYKIYGDIYKGVPTRDVSIYLVKLSTVLAKPKSANLKVPLSLLYNNYELEYFLV